MCILFDKQHTYEGYQTSLCVYDDVVHVDVIVDAAICHVL